VSYQHAIEDVYWRRRIWPIERPDPKPSLDAVISDAQMEKKVTDYLRKSQALEDYWQRPLTTGQLQAEMERMAQHTKQPDVLRELFEALGNDPFVIAECLARPALAERLLAHPAVEQVKQTLPAAASRSDAGAESRAYTQIVTRSANYTLPTISDVPAAGCVDDTWTATSTTNAPAGRYVHTAVWTGSEMIVWGGFGSNSFFNTGGRYNPTTDSWTATSTTNAPAGRGRHTAVWTGTQMIVWGGYNSGGAFLNTGGRYNPSTDSWIATSTTNAPAGRRTHTAVWTGTEMIVWGGSPTISTYLNTGGRYNTSTDSWTATSTTNAPTARRYHSAIWTGSEMIVWGGYFQDTNNYYWNTGGRYDPISDSWTATSIANAPDGRAIHTAIWTGSQMVVWGGTFYDGNIEDLNTGAIYVPDTDSWTATSITNVPGARYRHTAVWTGGEMIIWGGTLDDASFLNTGGRYSLSTDSWTATSSNNVPSVREAHTAVWTGSQMIVWGGYNGGYEGTGGRYCAQTGPSPTPTPTATASPTPTPTPRATGTPTPTATPAVTPTATATPTATLTPTPTPTATTTATPTPMPTARPTPAPRARPTPAPRP
jgi:N-acetylneuraminic acid mutarotase